VTLGDGCGFGYDPVMLASTVSSERAGLRSLLATPWVYSVFSGLVGATAAREEFVRRYVRPSNGDSVLDIGCGPGDLLDFLPAVRYMGFDISHRYVEAARRKFGDRGEFLCARVGDVAAVMPNRFDVAIAFGVLHHLTDDAALGLFREARQVLKPQGRLVTIDGCWDRHQSRSARWLLARDRGRHVRSEEDLVHLGATHFGHVEADVRRDLLRIPYSHVILVCSQERS
jgi:SAM-dependent methyltransferase